MRNAVAAVVERPASAGGSRQRRSAQGILAEDTKVYATTAANEKESSLGIYRDEDAVVNGTNLHTHLAASARWR